MEHVGDPSALNMLNDRAINPSYLRKLVTIQVVFLGIIIIIVASTTHTYMFH